MKLLKSIAITTMVTLGAFTAVTYTSCKKDDSGCAAGYEGSDCKTVSRNRFLNNGSIATFTTGIGEDGCYTPGYTMTIAPGVNIDEIIITNLAGYGPTFVVSGVQVNGKNFSKAGTVTTGAVTLSNISGSIDEAGNVMTFNYRAVDSASTLDCSSKATKQ